MPVSFKLQVPPELSQLAAMDPEQPINDVLDAWGADAQTLLDQEIANVTARTLERAYDTGALASSVTGQAYSNAKNGTLIAVWFNNAQQYAEWNRYYAPYQEGPPIGLATYTNEPRHMLYDAQTEDVGEIAQWAVDAGGVGAENFALRFKGG